MNFPEAGSYLLSLGNEVETMKLGLENIRKLLAKLGNPETKYLKVQIAGTNGKGSVCAFLGSICLQAGIKTGVFTSPHLMSITERVRIEGSDISEREFARIASLVRETSERLFAAGELETVPTYFEQVTAIALVAFAESKVELAILETGLGGRFDAVTAAHAEICAITSIDLDHQEYLGETIEEIAAEKAAVIRPGSQVVIGKQRHDAMKILLDRCDAVHVKPVIAEEIQTPIGDESSETGSELFKVEKDIWKTRLGLSGRHQVENARVAIQLAGILQIRFEISSQQILSGLKSAHHPGRLEYIGNFLLDGAHNVAGAKALRAYLDEFVEQPITLIFGAMKDKNVAVIAEILFPTADKIFLTQPSNSRAMPIEQLARFAPPATLSDSVEKCRSVADAIRHAKSTVGNDGLILVTGSLYLVGEVRQILTARRHRV